jgi:hypothetical protein
VVIGGLFAALTVMWELDVLRRSPYHPITL